MKRTTESMATEPRGGTPRRSRLCAQVVPAVIIAAVSLQGCMAVPNDEEESFGAATAPPTDSSEVVIEWYAHAEIALYVTAGQPPWIAAFSVAMVQGAVYDAVNAIERTHQPFLAAPRAKRWYSKDAAAATAAYRVLTNLVPEQQPTLTQRYAESLAAISDGAAKSGGIRVGERAAAAMIAARENDGRGGTLTWAVGAEPGQWRPTPPDFLLTTSAHVGEVKPFMVPSPEAFRSEGPLALTSEAYAREFEEVKEFGSRSSATRTPDQTDVALYWHGAPWGDIIRSITESNGLSTAETARLFAMVSLASADATSACFNDKYYWSFWRPVTAISEAANDGNSATDADPSWTPLIDTPAFPEHPSGHSCQSAAMTRTLQGFFGTDEMAFSAFSILSGSTRSFTSFSQALEEIVNARVWSGVHFRTADEQGVMIGEKVVQHMNSHYFQPGW